MRGTQGPASSEFIPCREDLSPSWSLQYQLGFKIISGGNVGFSRERKILQLLWGLGPYRTLGIFSGCLGLPFPSWYISVVLDQPGTGLCGCHFETVLNWQVTHVRNSHEL